MREMLNFILNKILGVEYRYKNNILFGDDTFFLPQFSLQLSNKNQKVIIGDQCLLGVRIISEGDNAFFRIGDRVYIGKSNVICRTGIEFGNDIMVAWGVTFYDHDSHSLDFNLRKKDLTTQIEDYKINKADFLKNKNWNVVKSKPIKVCDNAWIGMNATILKGVTIGEGAVVAACAVVTKDVPPFSVVAGNPAIVVKKLK